MKYSYAGIWRDTELAREVLQHLTAKGVDVGHLKRALETESTGNSYAPGPGSIEEAIVLGVGRPALLVQDGTFTIPTSSVWKGRLVAEKPAIDSVIPSVGRIQLGQGPASQMIGTGWLIAPDVIVTNRHVAQEFSRASADGWEFEPGTTEPIIDFKVEHERPHMEAVGLAKVIHIAPEGRYDVALLQLARASIHSPVLLARRIFGPEEVVVIGYPAWDGSRNPGPDMARIFENVFEVKRLAPGSLMTVNDESVAHDCSTLGGNSGSMVWGLQSRKALGLHFSGSYLKANYAVPSPAVEHIAAQQKVL